MIGKPILRVGKIKRTGQSTPGSVDGHLARSRPTHNADPSRTPLNQWIVGAPGELNTRISAVLAKAGIDRASLRKDATIANDVLLSISPEWFRPGDPNASGTWDEKKLIAFKKAASEFLEEQFGPRLCVAVLHLDESTPHIQAVLVPIVKREGGKHSLSGRDYFNPERLVALQDAWEARLKPLGVGPREKGSTATHTSIKTYYSALQGVPRVPPIEPPSPPPMTAMVLGAGMEAWQKSETEKSRKRTKALEPLAAKGILYEAERRAKESAQSKLKDTYRKVGNLRSQLGQIADDLEISKADVARLRALPIAEIATALDYSGEIGKRENPIDLVKRVGGLEYQEAVRWLAHTFGPAVAGSAVRESVKTDPSPPLLTPADKVKTRAISDQLTALDAKGYRITIMSDRDGEKVGKNLGKSKDGEPERVWTKAEVLAMVPRLTGENARGGNVFVTPLDDKVHHALIDDLGPDDLAKLKALGYSPATVVETSPHNHQAVIKIPTSAAPEEAVNEWFKSLNREIGDQKITGLRHPMRLAGFQNRKPKHEQENGNFPFVRVVEAARTLCAHARSVVVEMANQMKNRATLKR